MNFSLFFSVFFFPILSGSRENIRTNDEEELMCECVSVCVREKEQGQGKGAPISIAKEEENQGEEYFGHCVMCGTL